MSVSFPCNLSARGLLQVFSGNYQCVVRESLLPADTGFFPGLIFPDDGGDVFLQSVWTVWHYIPEDATLYSHCSEYQDKASALYHVLNLFQKSGITTGYFLSDTNGCLNASVGTE